jgi:hypothetical protein
MLVLSASSYRGLIECLAAPKACVPVGNNTKCEEDEPEGANRFRGLNSQVLRFIPNLTCAGGGQTTTNSCSVYDLWRNTRRGFAACTS